MSRFAESRNDNEMSTPARQPRALPPGSSPAIAPWTLVGAATLAVCVSVLLGMGQVLLVAGAVSVAVATFVAYRWPVLAAMAVMLISGGYFIFAMTPGWDINGTTLAGGVRAEDVFMVGMLAAALIRITMPSGRARVGKLLWPGLLLGGWLTFETARNVATAGLSAPGELRFSYLMISVAFCLVASLDRENRVRLALKGFVLITVALPLLLLPLVLALNGWSFGPSARALPANVSLGLLLGLAVLWQCRDFIRWPRPLLYAATALGCVEILVDAHRSVWLAAVVVLGVLLLRQTFTAKVRWLCMGVLFAVAAVLVALGLGYDAVGLVVERSGAVLTLQDTAGIRVDMWEALWPAIVDSPIIGRGLGLYWDIFLPQLGYAVRVFPHSLYVMALVHLGAVGVLLSVWLWVGAFRRCLSVRRGANPKPSARRFTYASLGLVALGAIAAYGVAYGLEVYSVALAGICVAGARLAPLHQRPAGRSNGGDRRW